MKLHLGVHDESDDEDDVNDGEGDEGVVEGGLHLGPHQDQDRTQVAHHTYHPYYGHQHLKRIRISIAQRLPTTPTTGINTLKDWV